MDPNNSVIKRLLCISILSKTEIIGILILYNTKEFVCVGVLRPSQPNGVMSSAVSLPNHTFTGQA